MPKPAPKPKPGAKGKGLPLWAWGAAIAVGLVVGFVFLRKGSGGAEEATDASQAPAAPRDSSGGGSSGIPLDLLQALGLSPGPGGRADNPESGAGGGEESAAAAAGESGSLEDLIAASLAANPQATFGPSPNVDYPTTLEQAYPGATASLAANPQATFGPSSSVDYSSTWDPFNLPGAGGSNVTSSPGSSQPGGSGVGGGGAVQAAAPAPAPPAQGGSRTNIPI